MKAVIAWWELAQSKQTIESLRAYLSAEGVAPWIDVSGLRLKFWISDPKTNRWGAVMLWDSNADLTQPMPPNRATELIGYPPSIRLSSDIEAIVEGANVAPLLEQGLAFEELS